MSSAQATFDWGDACSEGNGEFDQPVAYYQDIEVGSIPTGKANVEISLRSESDVDIRLFDSQNGHAIIAWPNGDLKGPTEECTLYEGVRYCYSGYNGDGTNYGYESIRIEGITNRELRMSAFGYRSGQAEVQYSWQAAEDCVDTGAGAFTQWVARSRILIVGEIPAGKSNIDIALEASEGRDVDIQLYDGQTKIIAWDAYGNHGLLHGPEQETIVYEGLQITYSGYNGRHGNKGKEDIRISGTLDRNLTMKVYGYQSGYADVTYSWGHGQRGDICDGRGVIPSHSCQPGLTCLHHPAHPVDLPGVCWPEFSKLDEPCGGFSGWPHNPPCAESLKCVHDADDPTHDLPGSCKPITWCSSTGSAPSECDGLIHIAVPGTWACEANQCIWRTSPQHAAGSEGEDCGGLAAVQCAGNLYCNYGSSCGTGDQTGLCIETPEWCTMDYSPVCACNGQTFSNSCHAASEGQSIAYDGICN